MANTQILLYAAVLNYSFTLVLALQVQTAMFARKGYRLEGKTFRFIQVSSSTECAHWCLKDSQCLSVNYRSNSSDSRLGICELNNSTREKNNDSLKYDTGFTYYESLCRTPISQPSPTGTPTTIYTTRSTPRNATSCSYYSSHGASGVHRIFDSGHNKTLKVYCHFDRQKTWTMVVSFAFSNNDKLSQKPFWMDRPYSEASPNFDLYRMSLKQMENQRKLATEWRAVCNYNGSMSDQLDTVRGEFKEFDPLINATTGYRLHGHVIRSILVTSSIECAQRCLFDQRCESLNYHHPAFDMDSTWCELNNSTRVKNEEKFTENPNTTYYYLMSQIHPNEKNTAIFPPPSVFKSCLDVQTYNNTCVDGEYNLQISHPTCNKTVKVYCTNMNTTAPSEYITLKAGGGNNFSKRNYVGSSKQHTSGSTKTEFSKIRVKSDLTVARGDYKFAAITWWYHKEVYAPYASAADCHAYSCSSSKNGKFKMDLTGTGLQFVTPIPWSYTGYRSCSSSTPNQYSVSGTKQVVEGRCGGSCGSCSAKTLTLKPEGC